jgi:hypothetical protein
VAYTPPNTFADGTLLTAADIQGNEDALRVYLHDGIIGGDLEASRWIQTRHVQPPVQEPFSGLQHGVTGYQGGQWAGGTNIRLQFATKYLSGNGRQENNTFHAFPQTAFTIQFRQDAYVLYHYWWELENGQDFSTASYQDPQAERRVYVVPYTGAGYTSSNAYNNRSRCQETRNSADGFSAGYPIGMNRPFTVTGGYQSKQGTFGRIVSSVTENVFGLAIHSLSDRCGIVNWGVAIEVFYL